MDDAEKQARQELAEVANDAVAEAERDAAYRPRIARLRKAFPSRFYWPTPEESAKLRAEADQVCASLKQAAATLNAAENRASGGGGS
jgi:hypothetical protein